MKTLEAKPFDQNAENWKRENRLFTSTVLVAGAPGQKSNRYARTQKSSNSLIRFRCSNSCFLLETGIAGHESFEARQMTPQSREKTAKTAVFRHRWRTWKVVRSIAAVRQRPRTPWNWLCSFAFFRVFPLTFHWKYRAEMIFRLSRHVSCKNQENGAGKQWSLHAPLKFVGISKEELKERKKMRKLTITWLVRQEWWIVSTFRSVRASSGRNPSFLMKLELSETSKLSTIPVLPIMLLFNQFSTRSVKN